MPGLLHLQTKEGKVAERGGWCVKNYTKSMGISHFELHKKRVTASTVGGKSSGSPKKNHFAPVLAREMCVYGNKRGTTSDGIKFLGKIHFNKLPVEFAAVIQMLSQPQ